MRVTRTWTISLPPEMSRYAAQIAKDEHRTKSELVREALRLYCGRAGQARVVGTPTQVRRAGELAEFYRSRHAARRVQEAALRQEFRPIRRLHDRLSQRRG